MMSDRKRQRILDDAVETLTRCTLALTAVDAGLTVMDRLRQAQAGPAAQTYGAVSAPQRPVAAGETDSGPPVPDPTGEAAVGASGRYRDDRRIHAHHVELDRLVGTVATAAQRIEAILAGYGPPRSSNEADRLALARQNTPVEPGCESCARTEVAKGVARWVPVDSRFKGPTTVGGRLSAPAWLCVWCHDRVELWDRWPTVAEVAAYHEGRRVPWPANVKRPA